MRPHRCGSIAGCLSVGCSLAWLQVQTRYWGFRNRTEGADPNQRLHCLLPLLDMANHAEVIRPQLKCAVLMHTSVKQHSRV